MLCFGASNEYLLGEEADIVLDGNVMEDDSDSGTDVVFDLDASCTSAFDDLDSTINALDEFDKDELLRFADDLSPSNKVGYSSEEPDGSQLRDVRPLMDHLRILMTFLLRVLSTSLAFECFFVLHQFPLNVKHVFYLLKCK